MIEVSNDYKLRTKKIKQQNIKLGIVDGELTVKEVHFMTVKQFNALPVSMLRKRQEVIAKELKYSFEGSLFKTIMKQIEITVKNAGELKDKNVNFKYGLYVNNDYEYVDLGDYYIKDIEDNKGKSELVVTGYDKMINFMKTFKQSDLQLTYPCTMLSLVQRMCEICGVELYSMDFFNSDLEVDEDYFTVQELTYRDVLEKVAQSTLTTIFIKDNKLYLHKLTNNVVQKLDSSYLTGLTVKEKFGPLNALVLGRGDVEDNIESKDDESIAQNGRCEIRFDENEFVEYQREKVIDKMFEQIKGLEYYSFEGSDVGIMWLEPCDLIEVEDSENSTYKTIYLSANITINTGISSDIEADIPEETNTEYKVTTKEEKKTLKVERLAKKNEGLIQDLIEENTETSQKLTQVEQTVDGIKNTVAETTEKLNNDYSTTEQMQSIIDQKADNITSTVNTTLQDYATITKTESMIEQSAEQIQTVISASVGTTNLVSNSDFSHQDSRGIYDLDGWTKYGFLQSETENEKNKVVLNADKTWLSIYKDNLGTYGVGRIIKPIKSNQDYTLSFELVNNSIPAGKTRSNIVQVTMYLKSAKGDIIQTSTYSFNIQDTWDKQKLSYTFHSVNDESLDYIDFRINGISLLDDNGGSTVFSSSITNIQIELGKTATDWKISQNDFYEAVQQYSKLVQAVDEIESSVVYQDEFEKTKSQIKQTTDSLNLEVGKKVNNSEYTGANIMLKINSDSSSAQINADKISLKRKRNKFNIR